MGGLEAEMEAINISIIDNASWKTKGNLGFGSKLIAFGIVADSVAAGGVGNEPN